jgi:putative membrane protein
MSYLDDPRVFFAAERTLLAWQRTGIALVGLGFVVERFGLFLRFVAAGRELPAAQQTASVVLAVVLLTIGTAISSLSALQFTRFVAALSPAEIPRGHPIWFGPAVNYALAATALGMMAWMLVAH